MQPGREQCDRLRGISKPLDACRAEMDRDHDALRPALPHTDLEALAQVARGARVIASIGKGNAKLEQQLPRHTIELERAGVAQTLFEVRNSGVEIAAIA